MCHGRLYSPQLPAHSRYSHQASFRRSLDGNDGSQQSPAAETVGSSSSSHSHSHSYGSVGCASSLPLDSCGRSYSSPLLGFGTAADNGQQQQQQQCLGVSPSINGTYNSSLRSNPVMFNAAGASSFTSFPNGAAAAAACEDDVCITASGWLNASGQSGSPAAALHSLAAAADNHSSLLAPAHAASYGTPLASSCARRNAQGQPDGISSSSTYGEQLVFPSLFRPGHFTATRDSFESPFALTAAAAAAAPGYQAAASASITGGSYPSTPCSSCPSSPQSVMTGGSAAAGGVAGVAAWSNLELQLRQMQLADAFVASFAAEHPNPNSRRYHTAPELPADILQLQVGSYSQGSPIAAVMQPEQQQQQLHGMQQGRSYSSVLPLSADHFGVTPMRPAAAGCSAGGVDSLSAPLPEVAGYSAQLATAQHVQLGVQAIDVELQQLLQVCTRVTCSNLGFGFHAKYRKSVALLTAAVLAPAAVTNDGTI
jgi:hypothetical protein